MSMQTYITILIRELYGTFYRLIQIPVPPLHFTTISSIAINEIYKDIRSLQKETSSLSNFKTGV